MTAPDLVERVLGYRLWWLTADDELQSLAMKVKWRRGMNHARCNRLHSPPGSDCMCGLYAMHHPMLLRADYEPEWHVLGVIAAAGEMEIYAHGFRAERAEIIALCLDPEADESRHLRLVSAADRYGVRLVTTPDLDTCARGLAAPVPAALRPPPQPRSGIPNEGAAVGLSAAHHVWATDSRRGIRVGMTRGLRRLLRGAQIECPVSRWVYRGDPLARLRTRDDRLYEIPSPFTGRVDRTHATAVGGAHESPLLAEGRGVRWDTEAVMLDWSRGNIGRYEKWLSTTGRAALWAIERA